MDLFFSLYEKVMLEYGGRPHWAKEFSINKTQFSKLYPKWHQFMDLRHKLDPNKVCSSSHCIGRIRCIGVTSRYDDCESIIVIFQVFWNGYLRRIMDD